MYPGVAVARGPGRVDSICRVGLGESCTRTCAGCRSNEESAVRRDHRRTHERTAKAVFARHGGVKQSGPGRTYGCAIRRIVRARARVGEDRYAPSRT